jgi:hypothetical protein
LKDFIQTGLKHSPEQGIVKEPVAMPLLKVKVTFEGQYHSDTELLSIKYIVLP